MAEQLRRLRQQLQLLGGRDQVALLVMTGALLGLLLYLLAWRPLAAAIGDLERANEMAAARLARIEQVVAAYRAQTTAQPLPAPTSASLAQLADAAATASGLRMARFQPGSAGQAQIHFDDVPFDDLLRWFDRIEREHGVVFLEVAVMRAGAAGRVSAQVGLDASAR